MGLTGQATPRGQTLRLWKVVTLVTPVTLMNPGGDGIVVTRVTLVTPYKLRAKNYKKAIASKPRHHHHHRHQCPRHLK